ncbi:MAG: Holliday junction resolvase RuvX [bacterium]
MNILSLDIGMKKTGICLYLENILLPQKSVETIALDISLKNMLSENKYDLLIIGIPLNKDREETQMSAKIREIAGNLKSISDVKVEFFNEYLTTKEAERIAKESLSRDRRKEAVDSLSAMVILEEYLRNEEKK